MLLLLMCRICTSPPFRHFYAHIKRGMDVSWSPLNAKGINPLKIFGYALTLFMGPEGFQPSNETHKWIFYGFLAWHFCGSSTVQGIRRSCCARVKYGYIRK